MYTHLFAQIGYRWVQVVFIRRFRTHLCLQQYIWIGVVLYKDFLQCPVVVECCQYFPTSLMSCIYKTLEKSGSYADVFK